MGKITIVDGYLKKVREGIISLKRKLMPEEARKAARRADNLVRNLKQYMYIPSGPFNTHRPGDLVFRRDGRAYRVQPNDSLRRAEEYA